MIKKLFFLSLLSLFLVADNSHAAQPFELPQGRPSDFGLKEGSLISASSSGDPDVFIVNEHGYKRLFLNPAIFDYYGHLGGFKNVKKVSVQARDAFPTSSYYRNCETHSTTSTSSGQASSGQASDPKIYAIKLTGQSTAQLQWVNVSGDQAVNQDPDFFKKVFCINSKEFNWYQKGTAVTSAKDTQVYDRAKRWGQSLTKICHHASDNPENWHEINVADPSLVPAHLNHGDTMGSCVTSTPVPPPGTAMILEDGFYNFYETTRVNMINTILKLSYSKNNPKANSLKLYKKFPNDSGYSLAADFQNIDSNLCNSIRVTNEWIATQFVDDCTRWTITRVKPGSTTTLYGTSDFPPSTYSPGEYKYYVIAYDSSGQEIISSNVQTLRYFPVKILSPAASQSPVSNLKFEWVVDANWPTPCCYGIVLFDKPASSYKPAWSFYANITPGINSKIYDGPPLDPSKTYTFSIMGIGHNADYSTWYWSYPDNPIEFKVSP